MKQKIYAMILTVVTFFSLNIQSFAEEKENLYLLSMNSLFPMDYRNYEDMGYKIIREETNADYKYEKGSDLISSDSICTGLIDGNIKSYTTWGSVWSEWNNVAASVVVWDLKNLYSVSRVDLYQRIENYPHVGTVKVEVSKDGEVYKEVGVVSPDYSDGRNGLDRITVEFEEEFARYVRVTIDPGDYRQYAIVETYIFSKNYTEPIKATDDDGENVFLMPESGNVVFSSSTTKDTAVMVGTRYSAEGKIQSCYLSDGKKENGVVSTQLKCNITDCKIGEYMKVFMVEDLVDLQPISTPFKISRIDYNDVLLTGNRLDTPKYDVGTECEWILQGEKASDSAFVSDSALLFDGDITTQVVSTQEKDAECYSNMIVHLGQQMQIKKISIWFVGNADTNISGFEVYASNDDFNYYKIAEKENTYSNSSRVRQLSCEIKDNIYARDVKIVAVKKDGTPAMQMSEIAVYGKPCEFENEIISNYVYETEQPFYTNDDIIEADSECMELNSADSDVCSIGDYVSVIYKTDDYYQIDKIIINGNASGVEIMQSADGINYFTNGFYGFDGGKIEAYGTAGRNSRYVKVVMHKGTLDKISLKNIEIRGRRVYDISSGQQKIIEAVPLRLNLKSNNILYLDWTGYNNFANGVEKYKVYIEKENITASNILLREAEAVYYAGDMNPVSVVSEKFVSYQGLTPQTTYYVAVLPMNKSGSVETNGMNVIKIETYDAMGSGSPDSIFCINDYPYTEQSKIVEGVNDRDDSEENLEKRLKLLNDMEGISRTRWYNNNKNYYKKYGARGITFLLRVREGEVAMGNEYGNYLFASPNEPNLNESFSKDYRHLADVIRAEKQMLEEQSSHNIYSAPVLSVIHETTMDYLKNLYQTDPEIDNYYDVMEIHPYIQIYDGYMDGISEAKTVPEHLIAKLNMLKTTMSELGIDKPVTFSEFAWTTATKRLNCYWAELITEDKKAKYIPRFYIIAKANDVKNAYYYCFQDEAYTDRDPGDKFGIVDFYANPKLSYYSYYTMVKILKNADFVKDFSESSHESATYPNYAYAFRDEVKNVNIVTAWNASGEQTQINIFSTEPIQVVDAYGNIKEFDGRTLNIDGNVTYIISKGEIKLL